jgi:3-oxoacyl-[acyl-carrier-protein] synthase II
MPRSNVVITGLGVVSSIGIGGDSFFQSLMEKRSGIRSLALRTDDGAKPASEDQADGFWAGGPILEFDPKQYVRPRKSLKVMCREIQTAFAAAQLAIDNASLSDSLPCTADGPIEPSQVGTVFGSEMFYGTPAEMVDVVRACQDDDGLIDATRFGSAAMKNIMPLWMLKYLPNMPACHIGIAINALGPNNSLVAGDVSGPAAAIEAASCIDRGIASVMIAGGTGTRISTTRLNYRGNQPVSNAFDPVEHSSRPHDPTSTGVVGGEGAAAVILESAQHTHQRGAVPLAHLVSYANCFAASDGMASASLHGQRGSCQAIRTAIQLAMQDAGVAAADIGLIVSHACGDPQLDAAERQALNELVPGRPVIAPCASLGHTGAASGAIELATAVLAIVHQTVPPTIRVKTTAPDIALVDEPLPMQGKHAIVVTHTAEGCATALLLRSPD